MKQIDRKIVEEFQNDVETVFEAKKCLGECIIWSLPRKIENNKTRNIKQRYNNEQLIIATEIRK